MELIDKEKLLKELLESDSHHVSNSRESVLLDRNRYIVRCQPTVEAIPKADYETRLKADLVAMLEEIDARLTKLQDMCNQDDLRDKKMHLAFGVSRDVIQEKINNLKGDQEGEE